MTKIRKSVSNDFIGSKLSDAIANLRFQTSFVTSHGGGCWIFRSCNVKWLLLKQNSYDNQEEESCDREYRAAFRDCFKRSGREFYLDGCISFVSQVNSSR